MEVSRTQAKQSKRVKGAPRRRKLNTPETLANPEVHMQTVAAQNESKPRTRRIVGVKPIAELLDVKQSRVYDLAQQDLIPHIKLGRQVRFDLDKVEAWLEAGGQALPGGWRQEAA